MTATFSEAVTVDTAAGLPRIPLMVGTAPRQAVYDSGRSTTMALVFRYTVVDDDSDPNGFEVAGSALALNNSAIRDADSNDAILAHAAIAAADANRVDTAAPTVRSASVNADSLTLNYNEPLDQASVPADGAYALTATPGPAPAVTGVAINGNVVTLTLNAAVTRARYRHGALHARRRPGAGRGRQQCRPVERWGCDHRRAGAGRDRTGQSELYSRQRAHPPDPGGRPLQSGGDDLHPDRPNAGPGNDDLPAGLTFAPATRILSGMPTTAGAVRLTYTVSDSVSSDTATFDVTITLSTLVAMLTGPLTEAGLFATPAPTVTIALTFTAYVPPEALLPSHFTPTDTVDGTVTVIGVTRATDTTATLTLGYDNVEHHHHRRPVLHRCRRRSH